MKVPCLGAPDQISSLWVSRFITGLSLKRHEFLHMVPVQSLAMGEDMDKDIIHPGVKSVGWALVQTSRLHRSRTGDKLSELGLFAGQEQVLQALASSGPMTMGDLAAILRVRPPTASKTVSRLSSLKLVERHTEPGDARVVRVKLTKEGKRKAAAIDAIWDEVEGELLAGFDNKDRKRLRKLLRKAAKNLAGLTGADQSGFEADDDLEDLGSEEPAMVATA
jgi:DNA-binding MarR family transcriptional regulator